MSQALVKSAWGHFYHIFSSLWDFEENWFGKRLPSSLFHLWNMHQILNILQKKKKKKKNSVIVNVFPKLKTPKDVVKQISKKHRFRTPFDGQDGKMSETLVKSAWEHFYHIFSSLWMKLIWKISPLVRYEIWGAFIKTLTAVPKYPPQNCENSAFPIQMQLSKKREAFSHLFVPFLE